MNNRHQKKDSGVPKYQCNTPNNWKMSYIKFDKNQLVNLEYSLQREVLQTNRAGSYYCTTILGCNTRKYHGLLVCPNSELLGCKHVLLSSIDLSVVQNGSEFNLGLHKYQNNIYEPRGHKYIYAFEVENLPLTYYRVGGVVFTMERLIAEQKEQLLIKYTIIEANSHTLFRIRPFLAFRNVHQLSKSNFYTNTHFTQVEQGIKLKLYDKYPELHLQLSKNNEYIHNPDWYFDIEYEQERLRGYDYSEDLFVPGYFEFAVKKGESIILSAATFETTTKQLFNQFENEKRRKIPRNSFFGSLHNSAEQFFVKKPDGVDVLAGYPWYCGQIRQTFVALPGLFQAIEDITLIEQVIETNVAKLSNGFFSDYWGETETNLHSADISLWFFWAVQNLVDKLGGKKTVWEKYSVYFKQILNACKNSKANGIFMHADNYLLHAYIENSALTWMNATYNGHAITPRYGYTVEVNALWYNAICFALELAHYCNDNDFITQWKNVPPKLAESFVAMFWDKNKAYLADSVFETKTDWSIKPNQVISIALKYTPLTLEMKKSVLNIAQNHLLTPKGLRTLSPQSKKYRGVAGESEESREKAMHQGSVFPWLMGFFIEAYLSVYNTQGLPFVKRILDGFENEMHQGCIGSIAEMFEGNPPYKSIGAISQVWSVSEIIRAYSLIYAYYEKKNQQEKKESKNI